MCEVFFGGEMFQHASFVKTCGACVVCKNPQHTHENNLDVKGGGTHAS